MKKIYIAPSVETVNVNKIQIIATSNVKMASGEGEGTHEAESKHFYNEYDDDDEW